jgi:hypothetical protein
VNTRRHPSSDDNLDLLETSLSEMSDMGFPDPIGRPPIEEHGLLADAAYASDLAESLQPAS